MADGTHSDIDGESNQEAIQKSIDGRGQTGKSKVFAVINEAGDTGDTCKEIEHITNLPHETASAGIYDLIRDGRIHVSGQQRNETNVYLAGPAPETIPIPSRHSASGSV